MTASGHAALLEPPVAVRDGVRRALTAAPDFGGLDADDRRTIAHSLVRIAQAARLLEAEAGTAVRPPTVRAMDAGDEFSGAAVDRVAATTQRVLNAISFPRFVAELIQGVFRAMVETNQRQLQQYVELVRGVSQSLDGFASLAGDEDSARRWLADRFPQSYSIEEPDPDDPPDPDDDPEPVRLITAGPPPGADALRSALGLEADAEIPSGGGETLVPFVRRSLARNRQQTLATMVKLGMQRIVINSGRINAAMRFHIDARSAAAEDRSSSFDTRTTVGASASGGIGLWNASVSASTTIGYVSTTDVSTSEELNTSADLNSSVELHFRTDQVPLDRIASQETVQRLTLNTLNPENELDIARQADDARLTNRTQAATARDARPRPTTAPTAPAAPTVPPPPPRDANLGQSREGSRTGAGSGSGGTPAAGTDATQTTTTPAEASRSATTAPAGGGATTIVPASGSSHAAT